MSALTAIFDADVAAIEGEMPVTCYFHDKPLAGQKTPTVASVLGQDAGYAQEFDFEVIFRSSAVTAAWTDTPTENDTLELADSAGGPGRTLYTIRTVTPSQDGVCVTYGLKAQN